MSISFWASAVLHEFQLFNGIFEYFSCISIVAQIQHPQRFESNFYGFKKTLIMSITQAVVKTETTVNEYH